jgi:hypothetical protein
VVQKVDFDKLRTFIESCKTKARADNPDDYQESAYWSAAIEATHIICDFHTQLSTDRNQDTYTFLQDRARNMRAAGLEPRADSMIFAYILHLAPGDAPTTER